MSEQQGKTEGRPPKPKNTSSSGTGKQETEPKQQQQQQQQGKRRSSQPRPSKVNHDSAPQNTSTKSVDESVAKTTNAVAEEEDDENRCVVCCEPMEYCGLGECGHKVCCGLCVFRLRLLHKDDKCVMCKMRLERMFIVRPSDDRPHDALVKMTWGRIGTGMTIDDQSDIFYMNDCLEFKKHMDYLREPQCGECPEKFPSVKQMEKHLLDAHGKLLCKLCLEHRGLFLMEHQRMTPMELQIHCKSGEGMKSFEGHPACKFCKNAMFYNTDMLYKHLNEAHESCHLCAKQGTKYQYFRDYKSLEMHFDQAHFACHHPRCVEQRFVAFLTDLQLQAHMASEHADSGGAQQPLNLDFVYRGSRRAQHMHEEEEEDFGTSFGRTPSSANEGRGGVLLDEAAFPRLGGGSSTSNPLAPRSVYGPRTIVGNGRDHNNNSRKMDLGEEFPKLGLGSSSTSSASRAKAQPSNKQRYSQTATSQTSNSSSIASAVAGSGRQDSGKLLGALSFLSFPGSEQEVRSWCGKLASGETTPSDFYDYMYNLLGDVALSAVFGDIQRIVGDTLASKLEEVRRTRNSRSAPQWEPPVSRSAAAQQRQQQPMAAPGSRAELRLNDDQAFPSLSGTARPSTSNRMSKAEVRQVAFSKKPVPRAVMVPAGVKPLSSSKREEEAVDPKLDLTSAKQAKSKQQSGAQQKNKKSERQQILEMALKYG